MHNVILINAAGTRTEHEFSSLDIAMAAIGSKWSIVLDGRVGFLHLPQVTTTGPDRAEFVADVEASEDLDQFRYAHLPERLQAVSKRFYNVAEWMVLCLPACRQRSIALVDLLRAKDAAVRARLSK